MEQGTAVDPVCGMTVEITQAAVKGLTSTYEGTDHWFFGKGCKLEFEDGPATDLAPDHVPSM